MKIDRTTVQWRRAGDELLVLHLPSSRYLQLNGSAGVLWDLVLAGTTGDAMQRRLSEHYGLTADRAQRDVAAFVQGLRDAGVLSHDDG